MDAARNFQTRRHSDIIPASLRGRVGTATIVVMTASTEPAARPWGRPAVVAATLGGIGRIGFAPGTFGAAVGLVLALATATAAGWMSSASAMMRSMCRACSSMARSTTFGKFWTNAW